MLAYSYRGKFTKEKVVCIWAKSSYLEYLNHVEELSMYVSNHRNGRSDMNDIALLHQQLLCFGAYCLDYGLSEQFFFVEPFDAFVEINARCRLKLAFSHI